MTLRTRIRDNWVSWAVLILALASAAQLAYFSNRNGQITACQVRYNVALARTIDERSEIASNDRVALNEMIRLIVTGRTPEERSRAVRMYLAQQDLSDKLRAQNPYPKLPPGECK